MARGSHDATSALDLEIRNFGPIVSGKISLRPMTVLMGPNNSGKSYAALAIHSVLTPSMQPPEFSASVKETISRLLASEERPLVLERRTASKISKHLASEIAGGVYVRIGRLFSDDFGSLIRMGSKKCALKIRTEYFSANLSIPGNTHKILPSDFRIQFVSRAHPTEPGTITAHVPYPDEYADPAPRSASFDRRVLSALWSIRSQMQPLRSFYLPASRSGILQGHKALSASIVRHAPYAGPRDEAPKLSGVVSDFVGDMLEIGRPSVRPPFYDVASAMEGEILHGQVKLTRSLLPEIKFSHRERDFPLDLASSTVSEMAPLVLYLKHVITKPGLLIIEEPEAHLHPRNQTALVKFLARLVRRGMKVLFATHSPFIVEQLSNLIQAGAAPDSPETPGAREDFLVPAEVGAYSFEPASSGYAIRELKVSKESGLRSEEFARVTARLYDDFLKMQNSTEGDGQRR